MLGRILFIERGSKGREVSTVLNFPPGSLCYKLVSIPLLSLIIKIMLLTKFQIVIKLILISDCMKESVLTHSLTQNT